MADPSARVIAGSAPRGPFIALPRAMLSDHAWPWLAPTIALLVVFALFPFFYNVWLSFQEFVPRERAL